MARWPDADKLTDIVFMQVPPSDESPEGQFAIKWESRNGRLYALAWDLPPKVWEGLINFLCHNSPLPHDTVHPQGDDSGT
jgi:hypothetical protein